VKRERQAWGCELCVGGMKTWEKQREGEWIEKWTELNFNILV
jgi:hypothetical protein